MENLVPEIKTCLICHHDDGTYSLSVKIKNTMVSTSCSHQYNVPGNRFEVEFFNLTIENMYQIAGEIIKAVNLTEASDA
jgi:hypothetical protein